MTSHKRVVLLAFVWMVCLPAVAVAEDGDKDKDRAKVEFRWMVSKPIPGVTKEAGIHASETGELSYLHKKPVLSHEDVESAYLQKTEFGAPGFGTNMYMVYFRLKKAALKKLAAACDRDGMIAVMIDGHPHGYPYYLKSRDENTFTPFAGFFSMEAQAQRIVAAFKKAE